jgi:hypothetical protein
MGVTEQDQRVSLRTKVMTLGRRSGEDERAGMNAVQAGWDTVPKEGSPSGSVFERRGIRAPHQGSWTKTQLATVDSRREMSLWLLRLMFTERMLSP